MKGLRFVHGFIIKTLREAGFESIYPYKGRFNRWLRQLSLDTLQTFTTPSRLLLKDILYQNDYICTPMVRVF